MSHTIACAPWASVEAGGSEQAPRDFFRRGDLARIFVGFHPHRGTYASGSLSYPELCLLDTGPYRDPGSKSVRSAIAPTPEETRFLKVRRIRRMSGLPRRSVQRVCRFRSCPHIGEGEGLGTGL